MKDERSISLLNLNSGEVYDTGIKQVDNKFTQRGHKMYNFGVIALLDVLTKDEFKLVVNSFDSTNVDYYNVYTKPFAQIMPGLNAPNRSRLKRKLIENRFLLEYRGKLMLNPFTFIPRGDKNIVNCNHLTQQMWKVLVDDCDHYAEGVDKHIELIFGIDVVKQNHIKIKNKWYKAPHSV